MPTIDTPDNRERLRQSLAEPQGFVAIPRVYPRADDFEFHASVGADVAFFVLQDGRVQVLVSHDLRYRGSDTRLAHAFSAQALDGTGWRPVGDRRRRDAGELLGYADALLGLDGGRARLLDPVAARPPAPLPPPAVVVRPTPRRGDRKRSGDEARFGRDLVRCARDGELSAVVGRSAEVGALCRILSKKEKNAALLVGPAGVGKSAVVEGLAQRMAVGDVPTSLADARILDVNLAFLAAGSMRHNEFEGRFKELIDLARADPRTILFLDEVHLLCAHGNDVSQMIKQDLGRGRIRVIGATTLGESRALERDPALMRRFQSILVTEPTRDDAVAVLRGRRDAIAKHHAVAIDDAILGQVVDLSVRFALSRRLPDKAIDLLDESGAFEALGRVRGTDPDVPVPLRIDSVFEVLSTWTTIPVAQLRAADDTAAVLARLPQALAARVLGQDDAIAQTVRALRRAFLSRGASDARRPRAALLFVGPSGVGKSELARVLADALYGDRGRHLVRIDMGDYRQEHAITRLVGAPPSFVGYGDGGELVDKLREAPHGVLLLDEVDKCHPRIVGEALLPLIGEGIVHSNGKEDSVDARNHVILLTASSPGLGAAAVVRDADRADDAAAEVRRLVEERLPAELLGRLDDVVVFDALGNDTVERLWDREVALLDAELGKRSPAARVEVSPAARSTLLAAAVEASHACGARGVRRVFEHHVTDACAQVTAHVASEAGNGIVEVDVSNDGALVAHWRPAS